MRELNNLMTSYLALNEQLAELRRREEFLQQEKASIQERIAAWVAEAQVQHVTVQGHTVKPVTKQYPRVIDRTQFFGYVQEQDAWHLLEASCAKRATLEALEKSSIPGIYVHAVDTVQITKARS